MKISDKISSRFFKEKNYKIYIFFVKIILMESFIEIIIHFVVDIIWAIVLNYPGACVRWLLCFGKISFEEILWGKFSYLNPNIALFSFLGIGLFFKHIF